MGWLLDPDELADVRRRYRKGRRIRLVALGAPDPNPDLRPGIEGVIDVVDAAGTVHVTFDAGFSLGLVVTAPAGERVDRLELL